MHAGHDHDNLVVDPEVDGVWKATQKRSPGVSTHDRVCERVLRDGIDGTLCRRQKLMTQACALPLVPEKSLIDVRRRSRTDNDLHQSARLRMRSRTSFQGMPIGPS